MSVSTWMYLYIGASILLIIVVDVLRRLHNMRKLLLQQNILLELIPPASTKKSHKATERFLSIIHDMGMAQSWRDGFLGRANTFAFEIVSSRQQGIRYVVRLAEAKSATFQQHLVAYLPDIQFRPVEDYMSADFTGRSVAINDFRQARHFAYPIAQHDELIDHDPISYITSSMTKLEPNEMVVFQTVVMPVQSREATRILNKLIRNEDPGLRFKHAGLFGLYFVSFIRLSRFLLRFILEAIAILVRPTYKLPEHTSSKIPGQPLKTATSSYLDNAGVVTDKLTQTLFATSIRTMVVAESRERAWRLSAGLATAFASFTVPGYQRLIISRSYLKDYIQFCFRHRLLPQFNHRAAILGLSELASLNHMPYGRKAQPENLVVSHSRTLPASVSIKRAADEHSFDVVIGENQHHGVTTELGLTAAERERHVYIVGGTGNGKTTLLQYAIIQDMWSGKGVAVIDPHGDLAETLLRHVPEERIKDVIYINPADLGYPIGLNLLELPNSLKGDELLLEQDFVTETVVSIFRKLFSEDDSGGHRIEYVLRNAIHTAFTVPNATLFTVFQLLTDGPYRRSVTAKLEDEDLKHFWDNELGKAGDFQRVKMSQGVTSKIGRFRFNASAKRVLEQPRSTVDFEEVLSDGKILICNFSKGKLGEDSATLFGTTILAKLQLAVLRRARLKQIQRQPFYLYVDEFQNFATMPFVQMLSEARKYKLFVTMAEQSPSQQEQVRMVNVILANVGTLLCFRSGSPNDEQLLLPLFAPYISQGEILRLQPYQFYIRMAAVRSQEPLSGVTIVLDDNGSTTVAKRVISASRKNYATKYIVAKKEPVTSPVHTAWTPVPRF